MNVYGLRFAGATLLMPLTLGLATPLAIHRSHQVKTLQVMFLKEYERQGAELVWGKRAKEMAFGEESPSVYFDSRLARHPKVHEALEARLPPVPE